MSRVPDLLCRPFCDLARACADRQGFRPAGRRPRHHHQRLLLGLCRHAGPGRMARRSLRGVIVVAIAMWSVFTVMTSFAWSLASLIVIRLVFGLTEGAFPAASF